MQITRTIGKQFWHPLLPVVLLVLLQPAWAWGQDADPADEMGEMQLIQRVEELQQQLESVQVPERDAAEAELKQLGTRVLDYLEPPADNTPTDAIQRTARVRRELEKIAVAEVTKASKITLKGSMSVATALEKIQKQTGNDVALTRDTPAAFGEKKIELEHKDAEFWVAIADIMKQAQLVVDPYSGNPGELRLTASDAARLAANPADPPLKKDEDAPRNVSGIFDLMVTRVNSSRNLLSPERSFCNVTVLVRWEPRVQPISIELRVSTIKAIDEFENPIDVPNPQRVLSGIVQPEIPELEFSIPIGLVDRQIEVIKTFDAQIDAVLPGRTETFRFKKVGRIEGESEQRKAGAVVTFGGVEKNEDLFGITVRLSFDDEHNALESHQGWAFNNRVYLENEAGQQFEAVAYETLQQTNEQVAIQYYFIENPQELTLVYKTPAAIVDVPVKIHLTDIPLP